MNDIYQYLIAAKTLVDGVSNNKVANFAYTQTAYTENTVDGVTEYSYGNDQNIPLGSHTDLDQNVRDKGIRSQAASLPRNAINHFFGRVSYNLNKLTDTLNSFIAQITRAFTQNGSFYAPLAEYRQYDTCTVLVTEDGGKLLKTFLRTSSVPEVIQGVIPISGGVVNTEHWKLMYSTDTVTQSTTDSSTKIASTELVDNKISAYNALVNATLATKAPVNHASANTTYGVATTSVYGHIKLANSLVDQTTTVPTSAILFAINNTLTNALNEKANLESPVFTGTVTATRAKIANTFIDSGVYLAEQDGFLIRTDIPPTVNIMTFLEFTMNVLSVGYPCIGIVQCNAFPTGSEIRYSNYSAIGNAPHYCRIFFTDNVLCFWLPKTGNWQTLHPVLHTNSGQYKIVSTTAAALPASRYKEVQANVLLPWSSINDGHGSGLDADTVDGSHYNAADILTKLKTVDGAGSGLDADTLDGLTNYDFPRRFVFSGVESSVDLNNLVESGFYHAIDLAYETTTFKNTPVVVAGGGFGLYTVRVGSNYCYQIYKPYGSTSTMYMRSKWYSDASEAWTVWVKLWNEGNDGHGSGLDADTVDGSHYNAADILTKLKTVDGAGSGLAADTAETATYATNAGYATSAGSAQMTGSVSSSSMTMGEVASAILSSGVVSASKQFAVVSGAYWTPGTSPSLWVVSKVEYVSASSIRVYWINNLGGSTSYGTWETSNTTTVNVSLAW